LMIGIVIVFADAFTGHWTIVKTLNPWMKILWIPLQEAGLHCPRHFMIDKSDNHWQEIALLFYQWWYLFVNEFFIVWSHLFLVSAPPVERISCTGLVIGECCTDPIPPIGNSYSFFKSTGCLDTIMMLPIRTALPHNGEVPNHSL
jgi:hypothetical protein